MYLAHILISLKVGQVRGAGNIDLALEMTVLFMQEWYGQEIDQGTMFVIQILTFRGKQVFRDSSRRAPPIYCFPKKLNEQPTRSGCGQTGIY